MPPPSVEPPPASSWSDLDRPPLSHLRVQRALTRGPLWRDVRVVASTGSTNADVAAAARAGAREGLLLLAEEQTAGRGRLDRRWQAPARSGVMGSALLRPAVPGAALPLLPLLVGVAAVEAVRSVAGLPAALKWPNDVLVHDRKLGGILVERIDDAVVVGVGLNVSLREPELPVPTATSVLLAGGRADREVLLVELFRALARRYLDWTAADGAPGSVLPAYREVCVTTGREVTVQLPGSADVRGTAEAVDDDGHLVVRAADGSVRAWSVGEVTHVRTVG